jgi:hypothetical protein
MGPHDLAGIEGPIELGFARPFEPLRQPPFRVRVVLRLDGEEVTDDVGCGWQR